MLIIKPNLVSGAKPYYYLHVSSFQEVSWANKEVDRLKKKGYSAIARREKIPKKGYWYRVYVGPFSAHLEAYLKAKELKKKKIVDYAAIQKKGALIGSDLVTATATGATPSQAVKASSKTEKTTPPEEPVKVSSSEPSPSKSSQKTKSSKKYFGLYKEGYGRNMGKGKFALGFRQTYQEVEPDLTKRTLTTSDGTTTTTQNIPLTGTENERNTSMHISSLFFRWGLADWFEVFGGGGVSYYDFSDFKPAYGGGLRWNVFEVKEGGFRGFYGSLQGEYAAGTVEYEYDSVTANKWHKEADWQEIFAKGELGLARQKFTAYVGGSYLNYQEETERRLLTNIPAPSISYVFNDELEEKSFGAFGGVIFNLSPSFLLNIEGQGINKKGLFGSIEYQF